MLSKTLLAATLLLSNLSSWPIENTNSEYLVVDDTDNTSCSFNQESGVFELKNFEASKVIDLFNDSEDFELISYSIDRAGTYTADYVVRSSYRGFQGESVQINWTCNMVMTSVLVNGVSYGQFVRINLGPTTWLNSGAYTIASASNTNSSISNSGTRLNVSQIIQLQTTSGYSTNLGVNFGWVSAGAAGSGTSYYRGPATTVSGSYTLPLANYI